MLNKKLLTSILVIGKMTLLSIPNLYAGDAISSTDQQRSFHGIYGGIQAGISKISGNLHNTNQDTTSFSFDGFIGYRHQISNNWVFGIETSLGDHSGKILDSHRDISFEYAWNWTAVAGKAFGPNTENLIYGKVGVGGIQTRPIVGGNALPYHNYKGMFWAIGYERTVSKHIGLRAEVSYISYDPSFDQVQSKIGVVFKF